MPIYIVDYYARLEVLKKAKEGNSQPLVSCLESIDASLWLIAGNRIAQALVMLQNSIEIVFKAELEQIHPLLISETRKLDYQAIKSLLKKFFESHNRHNGLEISEFSLEKNFDTNKTINFDEAMVRVSELFPLVKSWKSKLSETKRSRNDITHYGSKADHFEKYVEQLVTILFPFLEEFLKEIDVDFEGFVTPPIYREIKVAKTVCELLLKENKPIANYVVKTIVLKMLRQNVDLPRLSDITGQIDGEEEFEMAENMRKRLEKEWDDCFIETSCRICGSIDLFVKVEPLLQPQNSIRVLAAKCPHCDLDITENESYLAEIHVGELSNDEVKTFLRSIGEWEES